MRIELIAVGKRMPAWVTAGFKEYAARLPAHCGLHLVEVNSYKRSKNADAARAVTTEGERLLQAVPGGAWIVALERTGPAWSTAQLAQQLAGWLQAGRDVALLVGGPDGLAQPCLARADACWSLSALTLPHPLVRVIVAEQIYRAWSLLQGHPYHR